MNYKKSFPKNFQKNLKADWRKENDYESYRIVVYGNRIEHSNLSLEVERKVVEVTTWQKFK